MKKTYYSKIIAYLGISATIIGSCYPNDDDLEFNNSSASISISLMTTVSTSTYGSISCKASYKTEKFPIDSVGFAIAEHSMPTAESDGKFIEIVPDRYSSFSHSANFENLEYGKTYYIRAFSYSKIGINYSNQDTIKMVIPDDAVSFTLSLNAYSTYISLQGSCKNKLTVIDSLGFAIAKHETPTVNDPLTIKYDVSEKDGKSFTFSAKMEKFEYGTTYYVRPFAYSQLGLNYGDEKNITTGTINMVVNAGLSHTDRGNMTAYLNGVIEEYGGHKLRECGFCYIQRTNNSTTTNPTVNDKRVACELESDGKTFTGSITADTHAYYGYNVRGYVVDTNGNVFYSSRFTILTGLFSVKVELTNISFVSNSVPCYIQAKAQASSTEYYIDSIGIKMSNNWWGIIAGGSGSASCTFNFKGDLSPSTQYTLQAFVMYNNGNIEYSAEKSISTPAENISIKSISVSTTYLSRYNYYYLTGGFSGNYYSTYKSGFCYSTHTIPTLNDGVIYSDVTSTQYNARLYVGEHLEPNTTYYIRGFIESAKGILYTSDTKITTPAH